MDGGYCMQSCIIDLKFSANVSIIMTLCADRYYYDLLQASVHIIFVYRMQRGDKQLKTKRPCCQHILNS